MTRPHHDAGTDPTRRIADRSVHARTRAARMMAAAVSLAAAAGIAGLMWTLPVELDVVLAVALSAAWCLWLEHE
jgi:hypothetical protein